VEDNSRWSCKSLRPRGQFSVANRLPYIVGPAPGSERLRIGGYGHSFHWVLGLFRDFGLSAAAVQRRVITEEQISALFWINILVGVLLGLLALAMAPAIAAFYHDPQLFWVTAVLATGFLFNAAGVQHSALLERQMRFTVLAVISVVSLIAGTTVAIIGANAGYGYWALVAMSVTQPLIATIGLWLTVSWLPACLRTGLESVL
jgi:O-antigen/teichoic acid export membrane protein